MTKEITKGSKRAFTTGERVTETLTSEALRVIFITCNHFPLK